MIKICKKIWFLLPQGDGWKILMLVLMMLAASVLEMAGIGLIPVFVAILADPDRLLAMTELSWLWERAGVTDFESLFFFGSAALGGIFVLKNGYLVLYHYLEGRFLMNRYYHISGSLFEDYMNAPYTFHLNRNSSVTLRNVTEEGRFLVNQVMAPMLKLTMNAITILAILILLMWVEPAISILAILIIGGVGGLFVWLLRNKLSIVGEQANLARVDMIKSVNEGIGGLKDIRVLRREPWFVHKFLSQLRGYTDSQTFFLAVAHSNKPVTETVAVTGMLAIAITLYLQGNSIESMITIMSLFGAAAVRLLPALREVMRDINNVRYYSYSVAPIYEDFSQLRNIGVNEGSHAENVHSGGTSRDTESPDRLEQEIRFENVSFSYPGSRVEAVSNISFTVPKGSITGLAGSTGAGKTTVVDLMLGLLHPQEGTITFDGVGLASILRQRRDPIGYVPQHIFLSDDTLERNIAFGIPADEIDAVRVNEAIRLAHLTEVVEALPEGVQTVIGERGVRLSGGQRQRIGIARALYHDPDVLILDEATSALDQRTEEEVMSAIEGLRGDRTLILITHRLTTLEICDTIWFLDQGRIVDSGTLESLSEHNASFRNMRAR